ncbi:hypothetical protein MMC11_008938 [Xylographa trunciseda]|nr:hypothetical protein [Xylographa trunciseda]
MQDPIIVPPHYLSQGTPPEVSQDGPVLVCTTISESNKESLFHRALQGPDGDGEDAAAIMQRLRQLDSGVHQMFDLKNKGVSRAPLRLLHEPRDQEAQSSPPLEMVSYIALSYCWHADTWTPAPGYQAHEDVRYKDWRWPISMRMFKGLLSLREWTQEGVWIDAVCINQVNEQEKLYAIGSMDIIYKSARLVVIALEDVEVSPYEETLLQECIAINEFNKEDAVWRPSNEKMRPLTTLLIRLFSARWFQRAWCSHEFQLGRNAVFLVPGSEGYIVVESTILEYIFWLIKEHAQHHEDLFSKMAEVEISFDILSRMAEQDAATIHQSLSRPYTSIFRDVLLLESSEISDKLSIAVNISTLGLYLKEKAENIERCRWILAMLALAAGDATILCGLGDHLYSTLGPPSISWLQWPADHDSVAMMDRHPKLSADPGIVADQNGQISLDILLMTKCAVYQPTSISFGNAERFMKCCLSEHSDILTDLNSAWMGLDHDSRRFYDGLTYYINVLACSLDCGMPWMAKALILTPGVAPDGLGFGPSTLQSLWGFAASVLFENNAMSNDTEDSAGDEKQALLKYIGFVLRTSAVNFMDTIRTVKLVVGDLSTTAMTASPPVETSSRTVLAVPAALAHPAYATVKRLWYLEPLGSWEEGLWRIVRKEILFGCPPLKEDGESVLLRSSQRFTA